MAGPQFNAYTYAHGLDFGDDRDTRALYAAAYAFEAAEGDLRRVAMAAQANLATLLKSLDGGGQHVNPRGVLQSVGVNVDRLCAVRQERLEALIRLEDLFNIPKGLSYFAQKGQVLDAASR